MKDLFDLLKSRFVKAGASVSVTLKSLSLGSQGTTTGQYVKEYASSTINMIILQQSVNKLYTVVGEFLQVEAIGLTDTQIFEGDEIVDANSDTWLIESVVPQNIGDQNVYYHCTLKATIPAGSERTYPHITVLGRSGVAFSSVVGEVDNPEITTNYQLFADPPKKTPEITTNYQLFADPPKKTPEITTVYEVSVT